MSELSFQEGSVYNSEMECTNFEQQSHTEPLDAKLVPPDQKSESQCSLPQMGQSNMIQVTIYTLPIHFIYHTLLMLKFILVL